MGLFDYGTLTQERQAEAAKIPEEVLAETINLNFPEGVEELAALLTFIPEEKRAAANCYGKKGNERKY